MARARYETSARSCNLIDPAKNELRKISTDLSLEGTNHSLALSADDRFVVAETRSEDLFTFARIPVPGGPAEPLLFTTRFAFGFDVASDGSIFMDQTYRPFEVARLPSPSSPAERVVVVARSIVSGASPPGFLTDGRYVMTSVFGGKSRLVVAKIDEDPKPLIQTSEETSGPTTTIGRDQIAFLLGSPGSRTVAVASVNDGRIVERFDKLKNVPVIQLASDPAGDTLYYVAAGKVWSLDKSTNAEPHFVRNGDSVAVDPGGRYLVIQLREKDDVRLVRLPLNGGNEEPLSFPGIRFAGVAFTAHSIRADGSILASLAVGTWDWPAAVLYPDSGKAQRVSLPSVDVHSSSWTADGNILLGGYGTESALWQFKPKAR